MPHRIEMLMELNDGLERHLVTPEQLIAAAPDPVDTEVWAERLDLASAAMRYRSEKERLGLMEFSDLIARAVRLVGEFPDVAQRLGDRYDVVLLDEYQDTDPAQRLLLTSIFGPDTAVTAVGDTDQTIYEWRGASLDNFEAFPRHFPRSDGTPTETLPLSRNRRSDRHILDVANRIRDELPALDGAEDLKPGPDVQDGTVVTAWFSSEREEAAWIADDIVRRHDTGIPWSEIAVLVRKRAWIPELIAELHRADIPMSVSDPGTLLGIPEVADVLAWLRIVADPHAETALLRILLGGQYRLGLADINAMRLRAKAVGAESIFGALADVGMIEGLTDDTRDRLERFVVVHERVLRFAQANSVAATINRIVTEIGFWDEAAALRPGEATSARLNISRFMNLANGWRPIEGRPTVQRFLRYVDALDMTGREDALTPPIRPVADAIELTTVHGAKGLEWDAVYLPGLQDKDFPSSVRAFDDPDDRSRVVPYELRLDADSLTDVRAASGEERKAILRERNTASEYRLAYVAITRARRILTLSGHAWQDSVKRPKQPSDLLTMVREMAVSSDGPWCEDPGDKPPHRTATSTEPIDDPVFADGVEHALRQMMHDHDWSDQVHPDRIETVHALAQQMALEIGDLVEPTTQPEEPGFSTSVTNLVTLAECPLRFRWIHYDRMPRRPTAAAQRGTEFHRRVELHNLGRIALDDASPAAYDSVDDDTTETPTERSDPWGTFESSRFFDLRARFTEVPFEVALGVGSVRGKIDAVYEHAPQVWEIVDYKSGRAKT
ncbi:MAG: ATP-dependent helicase, partial [Acidimicrobiia bacterium]|nr:ATP-dependent helicase [Acidimicrobiia bacterium]